MLIDLNREEVCDLIETLNAPYVEIVGGSGPNRLPPGHKLNGLMVRLLSLKDLYRADQEARTAQEYIEREGAKLRRE